MQRLAGGTIRDSEAEVIIKLWKSNIQDDTSEDKIREMLDNKRERKDRFILIYHNYKPVGFIAFNIKDGKGHIAAIAVEPEYRIKGNGMMLLKMAEGVLKKSGYKEIIVEARMDNKDAIEFYERAGYIVIQELDGYYRDVKGVQLGKQLS